jgi:hypothetical protein
LNSQKRILIFLFLLPLQLIAQDITGLWTGFLQIDTTKLHYELVVSKNEKELIGYSMTVFNINNFENIGIKNIVLKNKNGKLFVEDKDLVFNNYTTPPKSVKQYDYLVLNTDDSLMTLKGSFRTRSWESRSYSGTVYLQKRKIDYSSKLLDKLQEINLSNSLSFVQPKIKQEKDVAIAPVPDKLKNLLPKEKEVAALPIVVAPQKSKEKNATIPSPTSATAKVLPGSSLPKIKEKEKVQGSAIIKDKNADVASIPKAKIIVQPPSKQISEINSNITAVQIAARKIETIRTLFVKSDSLLLSLYDNGEIDGDTVSILINGKVILADQGLGANPIKKTIYFTPDLGDSLQLIMYAENLGEIPPNTGLLIVQDGDDRYEIRFTGDLQKNSAIILKRKLKTGL